jgi:hypothetical protein
VISAAAACTLARRSTPMHRSIRSRYLNENS